MTTCQCLRTLLFKLTLLLVKLILLLSTAAGSGYNNGTYDNVAINGDGTGGRVSIVIDGGKIISATVTSGGTGYTFGKISVDNITGIGTGTGGQVDVIIPPPGGHGNDAVVELVLSV